MTDRWIKQAAQLGGLRRANLPSLWLVIDSARLADPLTAIAALPPGAGVILRDYSHPARTAWAKKLADLCRANGLFFLVGGDSKLAFRVRADGVHWPEKLARRSARGPEKLARFRARGLVSMAAHGPAGLVRARRIGADLVFISPVFPTASHPGAPGLGPGRFAALARRAPCPAFALGGVGPGNIARLRSAGAAGIAAIAALEPRP